MKEEYDNLELEIKADSDKRYQKQVDRRDDGDKVVSVCPDSKPARPKRYMLFVSDEYSATRVRGLALRRR